jgi:ribose 5-phosphate isomerase B
MKKIYLGSDHAGFKTKEKVKLILENLKIPFSDQGTYSEDSCDYNAYAKKVTKNVLDKKSKGILICNTGIGMSISANRFKGIRAALVKDENTTKLSRKHNDSNILVLPSSFNKSKIEKIIKIWITTKFSNEERHIKRIKEIER